MFDPVRVGFVSNVGSEGRMRYAEFDTALPGNGNQGHLYGTTLPASDKDAVVEYLKTF